MDISTLQCKKNAYHCGICFEQHTKQQRVTWKEYIQATKIQRQLWTLMLIECRHTLCIECLRSYLTSKLYTATNEFPVICSQPHCSVPIADELAKSLLSNTQFDLWLRKKEENDPKNIMYCPNKRCSLLIRVVVDGVKQASPMFCPQCQLLLCLECKVAYHQGLSCQDYRQIPLEQRADEDWDALIMAGQNHWRRCPKCLNLVEITNGCKRIVCACRTEFCYGCGKIWERNTLQGRHKKCCNLNNDHNVLAKKRHTKNEAIKYAKQMATLMDHHDNTSFTTQETTSIRNRGIDLNRVQSKPWIEKMKSTLKCAYCKRQCGSISGLQRHLEATSHPVYYCCNHLFLDEHALNVHKEKKCTKVKRNTHSVQKAQVKSDLSKQPTGSLKQVNATSVAVSAGPERPELMAVFAKNNICILWKTTIPEAYMQSLIVKIRNREIIVSESTSHVVHLKCPYCKKQFGSVRGLLTHLDNTSAHDVLFCCDEFFENIDVWKRHEKVSCKSKGKAMKNNANNKASTSVNPTTSSPLLTLKDITNKSSSASNASITTATSATSPSTARITFTVPTAASTNTATAKTAANIATTKTIASTAAARIITNTNTARTIVNTNASTTAAINTAAMPTAKIIANTTTPAKTIVNTTTATRAYTNAWTQNAYPIANTTSTAQRVVRPTSTAVKRDQAPIVTPQRTDHTTTTSRTSTTTTTPKYATYYAVLLRSIDATPGNMKSTAYNSTDFRFCCNQRFYDAMALFAHWESSTCLLNPVAHPHMKDYSTETEFYFAHKPVDYRLSLGDFYNVKNLWMRERRIWKIVNERMSTMQSAQTQPKETYERERKPAKAACKKDRQPVKETYVREGQPAKELYGWKAQQTKKSSPSCIIL